MKKKTMTILSIVLVVALTAVGFAAWLIVGTIEGDAQGSFISNQFEDKYFTVDVKFDTNTDANNGKIIFGTPTGEPDEGWLTYADADAEEKLTATATIEFKPDMGFKKGEREMDYYLLESQTKDDEDVVTSSTYRTIRVVIDIFEETGTTNYKWFDMGVELGYIANPTAKVVKDTTPPAFVWKKATTVGTTTTYADYGTSEAKKFETGVLFLELTYDMFEIQYATNDATEATTAVAEVEITFDWGTVTGGDNPYAYFNTVNPRENTTVAKYLNGNALADTVEDATDATAKTIRTKDLASRMISYLKDHVNTGLQFSITLSEGTAVEIPTQG